MYETVLKMQYQTTQRFFCFLFENEYNKKVYLYSSKNKTMDKQNESLTTLLHLLSKMENDAVKARLLIQKMYGDQ